MRNISHISNATARRSRFVEENVSTGTTIFIFAYLTRFCSLHSGETTAEATKEARQLLRSEYKTDHAKNVYGRKVDMLIAKKKNSVYDLSAIEWKKRNVDDRQLVLQQSKNIRTNKCNLTKILGLPLLSEDLPYCHTIGMDWIGKIV